MIHHFRKKWSREYLTRLQPRKILGPGQLLAFRENHHSDSWREFTIARLGPRRDRSSPRGWWSGSSGFCMQRNANLQAPDNEGVPPTQPITIFQSHVHLCLSFLFSKQISSGAEDSVAGVSRFFSQRLPPDLNPTPRTRGSKIRISNNHYIFIKIIIATDCKISHYFHFSILTHMQDLNGLKIILHLVIFLYMLSTWIKLIIMYLLTLKHVGFEIEEQICFVGSYQGLKPICQYETS